MSLRNVGAAERVARVVLGLAIFSLYFVLDWPLQRFSAVGIIPLLTGLTGFDPVYALLDFRTCSR